MKPNCFPGKLITFCGLDGCGKTTMISILKDYLETLNYTVVLTKQPTEFVRKSAIFRTYMDSPVHDEFDYRSLSLLAASDRVQHSNRVINPELEQGKIVISDRYFYSCLANLRARGYTEDYWIYEVVNSITKPDIAFFIDVPVDVAVERVRRRPKEKDRYIDMELQFALRREYLNIAHSNQDIVLSGYQSIEKTKVEMLNQVNRMLHNLEVSYA